MEGNFIVNGDLSRGGDLDFIMLICHFFILLHTVLGLLIEGRKVIYKCDKDINKSCGHSSLNPGKLPYDSINAVLLLRRLFSQSK